MEFKEEPISRIEWVDARGLQANDYNPNVVLTQELKLLEFSLLKQGWIQPILVSQDNVIIDGFHRYHLSMTSDSIIKRYGYQVPVVRLDLSEEERMMLTIRINRAKGNHVAFRMHEIVYKLIHEKGVDKKVIAAEIGASLAEIELLSQKDVFEVLDIPHYEYSKSWTPRRKFDKQS